MADDILGNFDPASGQAIVNSFRKIGDAGESCFQRIGAAIQKIAAPFSKFEADLSNVEKKASTFGRTITQVGSSVVSAGTRIGIGLGAVAAAGGLFAAGALRVTTALRAINQGVLEQRLAASQGAAETKKNIQTDFAHANALEDLRHEYSLGGLTIDQYTKQLRELQRTQERARQQQRIQEAEQEEIRKEQAKDQAAVMRRQQQSILAAQFGAQLAGTLERLATILETVRNKFLAAFGPAISDLLLGVANTINANADKFIKLFQNMATQLQAAFGKSGITIAGVLETIVKIAGDIVKIVITVVIPAFQAFLFVLNGIAQVINGLFGTNFTAGTLIAAAIILKLTGLFGLLRGAVLLVVAGVRLLWAAFGPLGIIIGIVGVLILEQLIPALAKIDWASVGTKALAVWNSIVAIIQAAADAIKQTWNSVVAFFDAQIKAIIGFFDNLIKKIKEFLGLTGSSGGSLSKDAGIDDIGKFAEGGLFRGKPGVDTNLAWLTDKEFVIKQRAVKHWGVGFLHAINNMRNPFRGFNAGGLVSGLTMPAPRVAFANGGLNSGSKGRPMVLQIGDQTFEGLTVQDDTANNMARYAARRGVRSAGRRPVWFGGGR